MTRPNSEVFTSDGPGPDGPGPDVDGSGQHMTAVTGRLAGTALAVGSLLAGAVAAVLLGPLPLPVAADLRGPGAVAAEAPLVLAEVVGRIGLLVPAAIVAVALPLLRPGRHPRLARLLPVGAAAPILTLLVAQVNGVRDVGALVLTYAATAAAVLIRGVPGRWPWSIAAMLGIVPWGVIALHQVGALLVDADVPAGVRVVTIAVLAATIAEFLRGSGRVLAPAPVRVALPPALLAGGSLLL